MKLDLSSLMKNVSEKRAGIEARTGKNNIAKPPPGKSRWRILPGWRKGEEGTFFHEFAQHWIKEPNPQGGDPLLKGVVVCEDITFGKPCECCDAINAIKTGMKTAGLTKDDAPWKAIDEMRGKRVYLVNALRTDGAQKSEQPVMLGLPETAMKKYLALFETRAQEDSINLLDLDAGFDVVIERTGSGFSTEYDVTDVRTSTKVPHEVMDTLINIDAFIEGERQRGVSKTSLIGPAAKAVLGNAGASPRLLIPAAASLVPRGAAPAASSRVIEADEVPFATHEATPAAAPAAVASAPAPAAAAPSSAPAPAAEAPVAAPAPVASVSDELLADDDLQALLANL